MLVIKMKKKRLHFKQKEPLSGLPVLLVIFTDKVRDVSTAGPVEH